MMQDVIFSGFVSRRQIFPVIIRGKQYTCKVRYYAFVLWVFFSVTWGERWFILAENRSNDKPISKEMIRLVSNPSIDLKLSFWERYSFLILIGTIIFLVLIES